MAGIRNPNPGGEPVGGGGVPQHIPSMGQVGDIKVDGLVPALSGLYFI